MKPDADPGGREIERWLGGPDADDQRLCYVHVRYPNGREASHGCRRRTLYVGRGAGNEVILRHPRVAPRHLMIRHLDAGFEVTDLGSPEGTWLNHERLVAHRSYLIYPEVTAGDWVLRLGPLELRLEEVLEGEVVEEAAPAPTPELAAFSSDDRCQRPGARAAGLEPWTLWAARGRPQDEPPDDAWPLPVRFDASTGAPGPPTVRLPVPLLLQGLAVATIFAALVFLLAVFLL
ncbi:MAG: FHA domain-containing protein [Acidobacteriota bacterium]